MSSATLYLVQANFHAVQHHLDQFASFYAANDQVILMGESVLFHQHPFLQSLKTVYMLEADASLLTELQHTNITCLDYAAFSQLCLSTQRCISLK